MSLTNDELKEIIEREGLGFTIQHYVTIEDLEDQKLAGLFKMGREIMNRIEETLGIKY